MNPALWVSIASPLIALAALGLTTSNYFVQRRARRLYDVHQFGELVSQIQSILGSPDPLTPERATKTNPVEAYRKSEAALQTVRDLLERAEDLTEKSEVKISWLQHLILAVAWAQVWNLEKSDEHWDKVHDKKSPRPDQIIALKARAQYHFNGDYDKWPRARDDIAAALDIVNGSPGTDARYDQSAQIHLNHAIAELAVGDTPNAVEAFTKAFEISFKISARWRRNRALKAACDYLKNQEFEDPAILSSQISKKLTELGVQPPPLLHG